MPVSFVLAILRISRCVRFVAGFVSVSNLSAS